MIKKRTPRQHMLWQLVWMLEGLFLLIVPIYLYGWLKGQEDPAAWKVLRKRLH